MIGSRPLAQRRLDGLCGGRDGAFAHGVDRDLAASGVRLAYHARQLRLVRREVVAQFVQHDLDRPAAEAAVCAALRQLPHVIDPLHEHHIEG